MRKTALRNAGNGNGEAKRKSRRTYTGPRVQEEEIFERQVLFACAKASSNTNCTDVGFGQT